MDRVAELQAEVVAALHKLTAVPPQVDAVIVEAGDFYVQFGLPSGGHPNWLPFEAVGDEFLPDDRQLTPEQGLRLAELGFSAPNLGPDERNRGGHDEVSPNWHNLVAFDDARVDELASKAIQAMIAAYRIPASDIVVTTIPSAPPRQRPTRKR